MERAQLRLARAWLAAGRRVTLAALSVDGPLFAELPPGIEIEELGRGSYARLIARLPGVVSRLRPDVLFCAGNYYTSPTLAVRLRLGRAAPPVVAKLSNALLRADQNALVAAGYRAWLRLHPRFIDAMVAMTPAMRDEAAALMGFPTHRLDVIPNPPARPIEGAAPIALPPGRYVLGVGRLVRQKRWDRLIAALPRLADTRVTLVILGEGEERGALTAQAARLGVSDRVTMPGHVGDPLPAIAGATLVALTSDYEGVPGVLREALSVGTPVVTTASSVAVHEIVSAPALGAVVPIDDAHALVSALDRWLRPDAVRPHPQPQPGEDAAARYLALFDRLVAG